jgi:hypothetical protein
VNYSNWLLDVENPFFHYVNNDSENSFDSFGCGINESFSCSSLKWTKNHPLPGINEEIRYEGKYVDDVIYVDKEEGEDEEGCGSSSSPCSSLSFSSSHFDSSSTKEMKILSSSLHISYFFQQMKRPE